MTTGKQFHPSLVYLFERREGNKKKGSSIVVWLRSHRKQSRKSYYIQRHSGRKEGRKERKEEKRGEEKGREERGGEQRGGDKGSGFGIVIQFEREMITLLTHKNGIINKRILLNH